MEPGTAKVTVEGAGNYTGTLSKNFTINKGTQNISATITPSTVEVGKTALITVEGAKGDVKFYTGNENIAVVGPRSGIVDTIKDGIVEFTVTAEETDYYYKASTTVLLTVEKISIASAAVGLSKEQFDYDGTAKTPDVTVTLEGKELTRDKDFYVVYSNNIEVGTATATIRGMGIYTGEQVKTFNIVLPEFTITFVNWDGSVLKTDKVKLGDTPAYTGTPKREKTAQYSYTFTGWLPEIEAVTLEKGNTVYVAQYSAAVNKYKVIFKNWNGVELEEAKYWDYGATPVYSGDTPTKAASAKCSYSFIGWEPEVKTITEETIPENGIYTYTAQFEEVDVLYTIKFANWNGTILQSTELKYGEWPEYKGDTPTRESTTQYSFTFSGWAPEITTVNADITYTAQYNYQARKYNVRFLNYDGTELQSREWEYGAVPYYEGATPVKTSDLLNTYSFIGWSPAITPVTGEIDYTAKFSSSARTKATKITVNPSTVTLYGEAETAALAVSVLPLEASEEVTWKSSNERVATVDRDGIVTATGVIGTATITATAADGSKKSGKCTVKVVRPVEEFEMTPLESVITAGKSVQFKTTLTPTNPGNKTIEWYVDVSDGLMPYVTLKSGKLTLAKNTPTEFYGEYITVSATAIGCAEPIINYATIQVVAPIESMVLFANGEEVDAKVKGTMWLEDGATVEMAAEVYPMEACQNVTWSSSNAKVIEVDPESGVIIARAKGSAIITATSCDGAKKTAKYSVTVKAGVESIDISATMPYVGKGSYLTPKATVYPTNANSKTLRWELLEDGEYDTISFNSKTGKITVKSSWKGDPSEVTLIAYATDKGEESAFSEPITVTIVEAVAKSVKIYNSKDKTVTSATVYLDDGPTKFDAVINPDEALQGSTWVSSDESIAMVEDGMVIPVAVGKATITVTSEDGYKSAKLKITVK